MSYAVTTARAPEPSEALAVSKGERMTWERRPTEWEGWLFCRAASGVEGWVPEAWLHLEGMHAEIDRDYDATELNVSVGDVVEGELVESGWLLAHDASGRAGWVPLACLRVLS